MHIPHLARWFAFMLLVSLFGASAVAAQDEGEEGVGGVDSANFELGVGLYLANCDSLVEGTALFDLGDAELETDDFSGSDENEVAEGEGEDTSIEEDVGSEEEGDETNVAGAIGTSGDEATDSDRQVVVQEGAPLVWVASDEDAVFQVDLGELVTAPFAVAIRMTTQDEAADNGAAEGEGEGDFVACGEFGGAIAGDQIILPLESIGESGFSGIVVLTQTADQEATASVYLFGGSTDGGEESATPDA